MSNNTIVALATPQGSGAIALIRLSGSNAIDIVDSVFYHKQKLIHIESQKQVFGTVKNGTEVIDEVLVSVFRNPKSYTGEDTVEISCHGSPFIIKSIFELLIQRGARLAQPGEFTQRAFINGKLDLAQAEAVADLIASESKASHSIALNQMRGGVSNELAELRESLINFTALIELELDFGEEDVEFASRQELKDLVDHLKSKIQNLIQSFHYGNAIKNGVPVAIVGYPNAGKSSLLNLLLNEERAIVSDIAGTTRDTIEEVVTINDIQYRFIDTAGLRDSEDIVENIGIERTKLAISKADIIIHIFDIRDYSEKENAITPFLSEINQSNKKVIPLANKSDLAENISSISDSILFSTKTKKGLTELKSELVNLLETSKYENSVIISNTRHLESLNLALDSLLQVELCMQQGLSGDLLAFHLRNTLRYIGDITGNIDIDKDILGTIFGKFCIGK
jgi:tRNA modification GTPase